MMQPCSVRTSVIIFASHNPHCPGFLSGQSELDKNEYVTITAKEPQMAATEDQEVVNLTNPTSVASADASLLHELGEEDKVVLRLLFQDPTLRGQLDFRRAAALNVDSVAVPFLGDPNPSSAPLRISHYVDSSGTPMVHVQKSPNDRYFAIAVGRGFTGVARGVHVGPPLVLGVRDGRPAVRFDSREQAELAWLEMWYRNETRVV
jgi:hypothetical protein